MILVQRSCFCLRGNATATPACSLRCVFVLLNCCSLCSLWAFNRGCIALTLLHASFLTAPQPISEIVVRRLCHLSAHFILTTAVCRGQASYTAFFLAHHQNISVPWHLHRPHATAMTMKRKTLFASPLRPTPATARSARTRACMGSSSGQSRCLLLQPTKIRSLTSARFASSGLRSSSAVFVLGGGAGQG